MTPADVSRRGDEMVQRGLKPATVYARVSRVSGFYRWLMADPQLSQFIRSHPVAQARPRYPRPYQSESTKALTGEEMNRLLAAVRRAAQGGSVVGRRDYALLLFYFLTGLRRSEVIGLRGKDLEVKDGALVIKYRRKGGKLTAREVSDPAAWEALKEYLGAAGGGTFWGRSGRCGRATTGRGGRAPRSPSEPSWRI